MDRSETPPRVFGVDFSGSADAGRNIWVTECVVDDGLRVVDCQSASDRFGVAVDREDVLPALTSFVAGLNEDSVVGFDFPFGLPASLVPVDEWSRFLVRFPDWFDSPDDLRERCQLHAELVEDETAESTRLRETDEGYDALSPYNFMIASQTFYGIRDVLRPLVVTDSATVRPMCEPNTDTPIVIEAYPAATLDELGLQRTKYKKATDESRAHRVDNMQGLVDEGVEIPENVRELAVEDSDGDALDSILAAFATYRNSVRGELDRELTERQRVEGYIYV